MASSSIVAILVPLEQEGGEGAVAGADGGHELDVELALGVPDVLAVGEVGVAAATAGEQHVLDAGLMGELHGDADLVVGVHRNAEDLTHLVMVRLDEQRLLGGKRLELVGGEVEDHVGAALLGMLHDLIEEVLGGAGRNGTGDDQAVHAGAGCRGCRRAPARTEG